MNSLRHLGVIMDGNRRWAAEHKLQTVVEGHRQGTQRFIDLCSWCIEENIPYVTVYAFSTENWNRPPEEVQGIFRLMEEFFKKEISTCIEKGVRLKILGNKAGVKKESQAVIEQAEIQTKDCKKLSAQIAINYGGRDEIVRAIQKVLAQESAAPAFAQSLTEKEFEKYLDTAGLPDIDLIIRTGAKGRKRLSGFFPWQSVYAEFVFLDVLWPDFSKADLLRSVAVFRGEVVQNLGG